MVRILGTVLPSTWTDGIGKGYIALPPTPPVLSPEKAQSFAVQQSHLLRSHGKDTPASSRSAVAGSVSFYLVAALVMVMVNKWVLNAVPVPLFFLLVQLIVAVLLLHLTACAGYFTIPSINYLHVRGLAPLTIINCLGLSLNTFCLQYVDASFYQVARGLVLPFTTILSCFMLKSRPTLPVLSAIGVVCIGFSVGVANENFAISAIGILLGICSSMTTACHAVVVKQSLPVVNGSAMDLAYLSNLFSAVVLLPIALYAEGGMVLDMMLNGGDALQTFFIGGAVTSVFGYLICIAGFISIKVTSPITHMISAAVRGIIQTALGVWLFEDIITSARLYSIGIILGGSLLYTYLKDRDMQEAARSARQTAFVSNHTAVNIDEKASTR